MLKWYICKNNAKVWEGYDDGDLLYRVLLEPEGWTWESISEMEGMYGYDTEDEAMLAAEADYAFKLAMWEAAEAAANEDGEIDLDLLLEEAHWDDVAHERMEQAKA